MNRIENIKMSAVNDAKKEWKKPQVEQINLNKTASGRFDKRENHPTQASS